MAKSTKSYEERMLEMEKKEQESLEKAKRYAVQKKELLKRKKAEESKKELTAMNIQEEPTSDVQAIRFLLDAGNGYDRVAVQALIHSINILEPGVCVELTNGDKGLVIIPGMYNVLQPYVLSFRDNQVYNLSTPHVAAQLQIKDIMRTMDNRHVMGMDMLKQYSGEAVHIGEYRDNKTY